MHLIPRPFLNIVGASLLFFSASYANATIFNLNGSFEVGLIRGADITGLISEGDTVFVDAFYDTDLAIPGEVTATHAVFSFPAEGAGVRFTVDNLTWQTIGPITVSVEPVEVILNHPDGTVAATYGGPAWLGYTDGVSTFMATPFGTEGGRGEFILYLPLFSTDLIPNTDLPTNLTTDQLAGPFFVHGAVAGGGPNGDYFFNFTSSIPEPETYAMLLAGLCLLSVMTSRRLKKATLAA